MNLFEELQQLIAQLKKSVKVLKENGTVLADREKEYKEQLRIEVLKLKDEGTTATLIDKIVYGIPEVSTKRRERDVAEAKYRANLEGIQSVKLQIKVIEELINKDLQKKDEE